MMREWLLAIGSVYHVGEYFDTVTLTRVASF